MPTSVATARSALPSPLKSPATTEYGADPNEYGTAIWKSPIAVAQEHRDRAAGHHQASLAVAVEIAHGDGIQVCACCVIDRALKCAITIAQQHGDIGRTQTDHDQVWFGIAVEVTYDNGYRICCGGVVDGGLEGSVSVAQQH